MLVVDEVEERENEGERERERKREREKAPTAARPESKQDKGFEKGTVDPTGGMEASGWLGVRVCASWVSVWEG